MKPTWTKEQIKKEIEEMDSYLPISEIEKRLGMPPTTLQKVLKGTRVLPKKWANILESYFVKAPAANLPNPPKIKAKEEKPPHTTNNTADSRRPFMSDAIKKKLGIQ